MKKNNRDKERIELDLTSLLDVIFIILMVVMCQQLLQTGKDALKAEEAQEQRIEAEETAKIYETRLNDIENLEDTVTFVTLYADYEKNNPKTRHLKLLYHENTVIDDIVVTPETEKAVFDAFAIRLKDYVGEHDGTIILLTLNEKNILYRDHETLMNILTSLSEENKAFFVKTSEED